MCAEYVAGRKECVRLAMSHAAAFGFKDEVLHDAVLLVDRTMSSGTPLPPAMLPLLVAACILISARQGDSHACHHFFICPLAPWGNFMLLLLSCHGTGLLVLGQPANSGPALPCPALYHMAYRVVPCLLHNV